MTLPTARSRPAMNVWLVVCGRRRMAFRRTDSNNLQRRTVSVIVPSTTTCNNHGRSSSLLVLLRRQSQHHVRTLTSSFSNEAVSKKEDSEGVFTTTRQAAAIAELTFSTPRVKALYEQMIQLEKDQVSMVGRILLETLDLTIGRDEFYYNGIGKYSGKGGMAVAQGEAVMEQQVKKKDKLDIRLTGYDDASKIKVIKEVRSF